MEKPKIQRMDGQGLADQSSYETWSLRSLWIGATLLVIRETIIFGNWPSIDNFKLRFEDSVRGHEANYLGILNTKEEGLLKDRRIQISTSTLRDIWRIDLRTSLSEEILTEKYLKFVPHLFSIFINLQIGIVTTLKNVYIWSSKFGNLSDESE
jgi:hypothetical protein